MAEVPVAISPDILVAAFPAAEAAADAPVAGHNSVPPAEVVSWFLSVYCGSLLLGTGLHGARRLTSLFSWRVLPTN